MKEITMAKVLDTPEISQQCICGAFPPASQYELEKLLYCAAGAEE
jgi:hypothetical protein